VSEKRLEPIERLVKALRRLPGIGEKTATRLAYFLLAAPDVVAAELGEAIVRLRADVRLCDECFNLTARSPCEICRDESRSARVVCVVYGVYWYSGRIFSIEFGISGLSVKKLRFVMCSRGGTKSPPISRRSRARAASAAATTCSAGRSRHWTV